MSLRTHLTTVINRKGWMPNPTLYAITSSDEHPCLRPPTTETPPELAPFKVPLYHLATTLWCPVLSVYVCRAGGPRGGPAAPFPHPRPGRPPSGSTSQAQKRLLIRRQQVHFMALSKFKVSKDRGNGHIKKVMIF